VSRWWRYLRLDFDGRPHRLYFEEGRAFRSSACTPGADGRRYRELLAIRPSPRAIEVVFDLPWHGKSSPPVGFETEASSSPPSSMSSRDGGVARSAWRGRW
jgi:hypothetical protein